MNMRDDAAQAEIDRSIEEVTRLLGRSDAVLPEEAFQAAVARVRRLARDLRRAADRPHAGGSLGFAIRAEEQVPLAQALQAVLVAVEAGEAGK